MTPTPEQILLQLGSGLWASQVLSVATRLDVLECLANGVNRASVVAQELQLHALSVERLLRGCAALGVVEESEVGHFELTPMGELLTRQHPRSLRDAISMMTDAGHWQSWHQLEHAVRSGEAAFKQALGVDNVFDYFASQPEEANRFNRAMASFTRAFVEQMKLAYDLSGFKLIADIGGGHGQLLGALLQVAPQARGLLFDQAKVLEGADCELSALGVQSRVEKVAGSFFESVPRGPDLYLLKHILHDWDDQQCLEILGRLRQAMGPESKLLIVEMLMAEPPEKSEAALMDLNMLVMTGGRERTASQYRQLLEASGLRMLRVIRTDGAYQLIEAQVTTKVMCSGA